MESVSRPRGEVVPLPTRKEDHSRQINVEPGDYKARYVSHDGYLLRGSRPKLRILFRLEGENVNGTILPAYFNLLTVTGDRHDGRLQSPRFRVGWKSKLARTLGRLLPALTPESVPETLPNELMQRAVVVRVGSVEYDSEGEAISEAFQYSVISAIRGWHAEWD